MSCERPLSEGPQFETLMSEIGSGLSADGIDIPDRPLRAVAEIATKFDLTIPLAGNERNLPPGLRENLALSQEIKRWYDDNYGDRIKQDPCPGRAAVLLDGDLYILAVPRIFGEAGFVVQREWMEEPGFSRVPVVCNVVQLVEGMTPARATRLSDEALRALDELFKEALEAAYTLEGTDHPLIYIARGDIDTAIAGLMSRSERFGESKWASLQAAEKVLKAAIDLAGAKFTFTHGLAELCSGLAAIGLEFDAVAQVAAIQCRPGIRYGEQLCSRDEALAAHHSSLELVNILRRAGAAFDDAIEGEVFAR